MTYVLKNSVIMMKKSERLEIIVMSKESLKVQHPVLVILDMQ